MISVLIANYNNSLFLEECLKSVFQHSEYEIELIVCDDCSTDCSVEILKDFQSKNYFKILYNEINLGVGATKKKLVLESSGEWFIFLDSDDMLAPNCLIILSAEIEKQKVNNVSMIYGNSRQLCTNGKFIDWGRSKEIKTNLLDCKFEYPIFHPVIYNRKKYDSTEGIDLNLKSADDYDLWYKMEEVGNVIFVDEPLYFYRINFNGVSQVGNNSKKWLQVMLEHAYCHASAARRRGVDMRLELDSFTDAIFNHFLKEQVRMSYTEVLLKKIKFYCKRVLNVDLIIKGKAY